jgi:glycosyltransferase involved in cell wall biosynthesis
MTVLNMNSFPLVSVIIPVKNGAKTIDKLLMALQKQDYPEESKEVIVVDNGSRDDTVGIVRKYPWALLEYETGIASSYAARNKGISAARGDILAFTDADCIPETDWIKNGVRNLLQTGADMIGGRIEFVFSRRRSTAEIFDSLNSLRNDSFIQNKMGAVTANLFVKKCVFEQMGLFPEVRSGGDINWTGRAMNQGFLLVYSSTALVRHPSRDLKGVLRKSWFCGTGIFMTLKQRGVWPLRILYLSMRLLIPVPNRAILKSLLNAKRFPEVKGRRLKIWGISFLSHLFLLGGFICSFFMRNVRKSSFEL